MKKLKKTSAILLLFCFIFSFAACKKNDTSEPLKNGSLALNEETESIKSETIEKKRSTVTSGKDEHRASTTDKYEKENTDKESQSNKLKTKTEKNKTTKLLSKVTRTKAIKTAKSKTTLSVITTKLKSAVSNTENDSKTNLTVTDRIVQNQVIQSDSKTVSANETIKTTKKNIENNTTKPSTTKSTEKKAENKTTKKQEVTSTTKSKATTLAQTTKADLKDNEIRVIVNCAHAVNYGRLNLPENGIFADTVVKYNDGDKAMDSLNKALKAKGLSADISRGYVKGICGLKEKDCGVTSGWMYAVNSYVPNVSADKYDVSGGDTVMFYYVTDYGNTM